MKTPQDKDESDTIPNGAAPPLITTTSPKSNNKISAKQLLAFLFSFAIGLVVGGYATSSLLESEYRTVISTLISNHQNSISDTKLEHNECHRDLLEAKEAYSRSTSQYGDTTCHEKLQSINHKGATRSYRAIKRWNKKSCGVTRRIKTALLLCVKPAIN